MGLLPRHVLVTAMQVYDIVVISLSLLAATVVYTGHTKMALGEVLSLRVKIVNFILIGALLLLCHWILSLQGLYRSRRLSRRSDETVDVLLGVTYCALMMIPGGLVFRVEMLTFEFLGMFWATCSIVLVLTRLVLRAGLARVRSRGRNLRHVLVVGSNDRAVRFAQTLDAKPDLGYSVIGFADEDWAGLEKVGRSGYGVVSDLRGLDHFLRHSIVDEVVIALPVKSNYARIYEIVTACEEQGITVRLLSGLFDLKRARSQAEPFEGETDGDTVVPVYTGRMEGWPVFAKQLLDVALAAVLIVGLSPFMLVTALLIKLTSSGSILFVQERVGINKRRFKLYKFRTMVADAEQRMAALERLNEISGPVFKIRHDPRVTTLGRLLRKTSIDELPQLFNVLKGDMSLVGPRPLPVRDYNAFSQDWHRRRFSVRPGITCLWQVNGRSNVGFDEWMKLDMQYIDQWSLWLDLKILVKTLPAVVRGSGAA